MERANASPEGKWAVPPVSVSLLHGFTQKIWLRICSSPKQEHKAMSQSWQKLSGRDIGEDSMPRMLFRGLQGGNFIAEESL